ncbi:amidohydrolase family protein (plasmid) [Haloferacaceae archaeon DSL9]
MHIDKSFAACGARRPKGNESAFDFRDITPREEEYFAEASVEGVMQNALRDIEMAVAAGTTYIRSHVAVNHETFGLQNVAAVVRARDAASHLADVQLVPAARNIPSADSVQILGDAIEHGRKGDTAGVFDDPMLVGGSDPAGSNKNIEGTLDAWFAIAEKYDVGLDVHIQDGGTLGGYTLDRLFEYISANGFDGRVTASHCYCLSHIPDWRIDELVDSFSETDTSVVTCYQSTRPTMPVRKLLEEGVTLAHGTDNDRDFVFPHGNADSLEGALIESNKLHGDRTFVDDYRWFDSNTGLAHLWEMITTHGAEALGIVDRYGIEEGNPASLVVFDEPSPQWAIIAQANRRFVIKDGVVVAKDGEICPEHTLVA